MLPIRRKNNVEVLMGERGEISDPIPLLSLSPQFKYPDTQAG
ncbi:hypothetical protein B6N60_02251 [Richelia sinica FACHB-800]|uniref:Uncharacterized protein n=1 Tax=Richelia sinica FACHB-800 TaxID=1357546 RepID=A0A975T8Z3_9NOST|nr:hypothetical protein B6N60_02251 [Richelia sinica FACHB-800]